MSRKSKKKHEVSLEESLDLKKDFPFPTYEEWKQGAIKDLRGKSFEGELFTNTYEEIKLKPIYTKKDLNNVVHARGLPGFGYFCRGTRIDGYIKNSWDICQEIPVFSAEEFNAILKHDLQRGQTAVFLMPDLAFQLGKDVDKVGSDDIGRGGISISHLNDFLNVLSGIDLEKNPIYLNAGFSSLTAIMMLTAYVWKEKKNANNIRGCIEGDPLGFLIREGKLPISIQQAFDQMEWSIRWAKKHFPQLKTVGVNTITYHHSGANAVQELAFAMASAVEYINQLQKKNLVIDDIAQNIRFSFGAGPFFFMEIAKFRAARILWSRIVSEYGGKIESQKINIHARTSNYNQSFYDPHVNMLRATTESLSAIIGGIDSLHTSTFNESFTQPDEFSRRIARNTQLILEKEVHLRSPIDPSGGSYYIETLTSDLGQKAWFLFQEIEKMGGMFKAIHKEFPQKKIAEVVAKKNKDITSRKTVLVGTNMYANIHEKIINFPAAPSEEFKVERRENLKTFKYSRDTQTHTQGLKVLSHSIETGKIEIIRAGTDALLRGATVGEVAELLNNGQKNSVLIKKMNVYRLPQIFEALRSKVEHYSEKNGSKPKIFLALWGELPQYQARADFSRGFFEVAGCEVTDSSGLTEFNDIIQAATEFRAQIVVFCSSDDQYPMIVPEIIGKFKKKSPEIIFVVAGKLQKKDLFSENVKIQEFIYHGVDLPLVLGRLMKKIGVNLT